jgi:Tol biopolymer transport system component
MGNRPRRHFVAWVLTLCGLVTGSACGPAPPKVDPFGYRQLTTDGGLTGSPSLSHDGKFVVYSSDRGDEGNLDIYVQSVDGGKSVRLTEDPAADYDPVFSADGRTVYFTSLREPQGIYRVAESGGVAEMVARGAVSPQVSPEGTLIFSDQSGHLAVYNPTDRTSRPLLENFLNSYDPKWSPEGKEILFAGKAAPNEDVDWWVTSSTGAPPVSTGILGALKQAGFADAHPQTWLPGDELVFDGKTAGEKRTLWSVHLSPGRHGFAGMPVRVTDSDESDFEASYAAGKLAIGRSKAAPNVWGLPAKVNEGSVTGIPERLTFTDTQKGSSSLSMDGHMLLYSDEQNGTFRLLLKNVVDQREARVGPSTNSFYGVLSADGARYVFGQGPPGAIDVFARGVTGWRSWWSNTVCERCGMPRALSRDGKSLLLWTDSDPVNHIDIVDLASGTSRRIVDGLGTKLYGPELSPQGDWISFVANTGSDAFRTFVVPLRPGPSVLAQDWVPITRTSEQYQMAFWSPDGNLLYLLVEDETRNLNWLHAQPLDPATKRPNGELKSVYQFRAPRVPMKDPVWNRPAAVAGRIIVELVDQTTNVWIMNAPRPRTPSTDKPKQ